MLDVHLLRDLQDGYKVLTSSNHEQVTRDILVLDSRACRIIWLSEGGDRVVRQYACECTPLDAVFCSFFNQNGQSDIVTVAILTPFYLRLHQPSGEHFDVRLSIPCSSMFATPIGLLLQAKLQPELSNKLGDQMRGCTSPSSSEILSSPFGGGGSMHDTSNSDFSAMLGVHDQFRPTMFMITSPTSVASPVAVRVSSARFEDDDESAGEGSVLEASNTMHGDAAHYIDGMFTRENEEIVAISGRLLATLQSEHIDSKTRHMDEKNKKTPSVRRTLRLWTLTSALEKEVDIALAAMRTTGASLGSRMSVGSRSSRGSANIFGGPASQSDMANHTQPRSGSPIFAHGSASPANANNTFGWGGEGRDSPIVGLESALGLVEGGGMGLGFEREGGGAGMLPLQLPFTGTGTIGDAASHEAMSAVQMQRSGLIGRPESTIQLLDTTVLESFESDSSLRFSFSGQSFDLSCKSSANEPLMLNVLDRNIFIRFQILHKITKAGLVGRMVPLVLQSAPRRTEQYCAMAHVRVPLLPSGDTDAPSACLTLLLHPKDHAQQSTASLLLGDKFVGTTVLECLDDLRCDGPAYSVTDLATLGGSVFVAESEGRHLLLTLTPALLLGCACSGVMELAALSALKVLPGGVAAANLGLGVMLLSRQAGIRIQPAVLMLRASFGLLLPVQSTCSRASSTSLSEVTALYAQLVDLLASVHARAPIFDALHAVWQDLRIQGAQKTFSILSMLGAELATCAASYGGSIGEAYFTYYVDRIGVMSQADAKAEALSDYLEPLTAFDFPPCSARWVAACLGVIGQQYTSCELLMLPTLVIPPEGCQCINNCTLFFTRLQHAIVSAGDLSLTDGSRAAQVRLARVWADAYVGVNMTKASELDCDRKLQRIMLLPPLLRAVIELALYECREDPNEFWEDEILQKIGRDDLCKAMRNPTRSWMDSSSENISKSSSVFSGNGRGQSPPDGLQEVQTAAQLRFADDDRVHEACRILRSSDSIYLRVEKSPETSDLDHRHRMQLRLLTLCRRSLACSVGRGALTMGSLRPLMAEALPVPKLNLSGRVPPSNGIVHLDTATAPPELTLWPEFHNGVAAGLRVGSARSNVSMAGRHRSMNSSQEKSVDRTPAVGGRQVTRNWIIYNRTAANAAAVAASRANTPGAVESALASHAGVILALGLQGHLQVLSKNDICDYLSQGHEPTTIAMLLGMAASKLGSADTRLSKTLCLYLPTLLPQRHQDIDISPLVQTAALGGLGLLHVGSGHRLMTEFLLAELSRRPTSDRCDSRESAALTAAWALGLVLLGKGAENSGQGLRGLVDLHIEDRLVQHFSGGRKPPESYLFPTVTASSGDASGRASRVLEGSEINTDITGPGALVALSLIYLRSNNSDIAKRMALPDTVFALDIMRPDMLLYRAMAISLVMWDSVKPSSEWIQAQVPSAVHLSLFGETKLANKEQGNNRNASNHGLPKSLSGSGTVLTRKTALSAYLCIITGYGFGMGLVFAGSGDMNAKNAIHSQLFTVQALRENKPVSGLEAGLVDKSIRPIIDMCISVLALSLSIVMAGTGDVECLRTFRELRWRVDDVVYGTHLALGQAIGLLFLGGGTCSVRRDPLSIACLLMSLCPQFPARTVDNQYHLQPFRHLYVLAVESRVLRTIDVDSGRPLSVDVKIELASGESIHARAPCLLPELETVLKVLVNPKENNTDSTLGMLVDGANTSSTSMGSVRSTSFCRSNCGVDSASSKRSLFQGSHAGGNAAQRANDLFPTGLHIMAHNKKEITNSIANHLEVPALCVKRRVPRMSSSLTDANENQPSARIISTLDSLLYPFTGETEGNSSASIETHSLQPSQGNELTLELVMNMLGNRNSEVDSLLSEGISSCLPLGELLNGELSIGI